jgi:hypothetical protein
MIALSQAQQAIVWPVLLGIITGVVMLCFVCAAQLNFNSPYPTDRRKAWAQMGGFVLTGVAWFVIASHLAS